MTEDLKERVRRRLEDVIDPETGVDVVRMRLIEDLTVDDEGLVSYTFHPSSPFCPLAVSLALSIRRAVAGVEGVAKQEIEVVGYVNADQVSAILSEDAES
ncbi:MAG: iron-sulfur cluster assembly protein [Chloroflexota bacterium]|nr:iron-sulfur cluster assembly protein [Chloroflexota bacterium]